MEFKELLSKNIEDATTKAMIQTICSDPHQTIGGILKILEEDKDHGEFFINIFRDTKMVDLAMQIVDSVKAKRPPSVVAEILSPPVPKKTKPPKEVAADVVKTKSKPTKEDAPKEEDDEEEEEEDDDDDDDDDEEEDDEEEEEEDDDDDDDDDEEEDDAPKKSDKAIEKKKKKKKLAPPRTGKVKADSGEEAEDGELPLHDPAVKKEYKTNIIRLLRSGQHKDKNNAISAAQIRMTVGGTSKQLRECIAELIENQRIYSMGKARGTRYYLETGDES